jgi:LuxR family transcriptional regulator, quorum-sensing system regulator BjaR1
MIMPPRAFRQSLDHTVRFVHDLDRARNIKDITSKVLQHLSQIGAETVIATAMPRPGANRRQQASGVLFCEMPSEWVSNYSARGYAFKDPVIRRMLSMSAPFYWNELEQEVRDDPAGQQVMYEGAEFGLKNGFSTSLLTLDGQAVGFSIAGKNFECDSEMRGVLTLIASYAIGRAIALQQEPSVQDKKIALSAREREALQWAAEGKNDWEIGEVMNITEHGADKHMRSVRSKLGAINRTQAVAEAIRRGLIA